MNKLIKLYETNLPFIEKIVEQIFELSLYIVIFLGHSVDVFEPTHAYKVFSMLMICFGVWLYRIRNVTIKELLVDLSFKLITPLLASIIVAYLTTKVDISNLYTFFYTIPVVIIYYLEQRKTGKPNYKESAYEYLYRFIGNMAIIPTAAPYVAILIAAILNVSILYSILIFLGISVIFNSFFVYITVSCIRKN